MNIGNDGYTHRNTIARLISVIQSLQSTRLDDDIHHTLRLLNSSITVVPAGSGQSALKQTVSEAGLSRPECLRHGTHVGMAKERAMTVKTFLVGAALDRAIRAIATSEHPRCAVAFLGRGAATIFKGGKAQIVCNLASGSTNPSAVKELQKQGHEVRQNDRLHAKVYSGGGKALVASANLSVNGLGLQDTELANWIEAGGYTEDVKEVTTWFNTLWDDKLSTKAISASDLKAAAELWNLRRSFKPTMWFSDFDTYATDVPLIIWYGKANYEITDEAKVGGALPEGLDDFIVIEAESDLTLLSPGTWVLRWEMNVDGRPSKQTKCSWFRAGPLWKYFVRIADERDWRDAIITQSWGIPPPFDCREPLFNKVFREVMMQDAFKVLRAGEYLGSFLEGRISHMRDMWPVLHKAYKREKAQMRQSRYRSP